MRSELLAVLAGVALAVTSCGGGGDGTASNAGGSAGSGGKAGAGGGAGAAGSGAASSGGSSGGVAGSGGNGGSAGGSCPATSTGHASTLLGQTLSQGSLRSTVTVWDAASGRYLVLFGFVANGAFRTHALGVRFESGVLSAGPELELADPASPTTDSLEREVAIADGANPRILAALEDTRAGDATREVMGQFLKVSASDGSVTQDGPSFSLTTHPGFHEYTPSIAWDAGANRFFVSWSDDRQEKTVPDGRLVFGRTVGLDGTLGPEVKLGGSSLWQVGAQVAGSGGGGRFLVAWGDYDLNPGIDAGYRARVLDASGQPASAILELARYGDKFYEAPAIAWQPCKQAWLVAQTREQKIFGTWIGLDGTILKNDLLLAENSVGAGAPRLVYSPAAHALGLVYHAWQIEDAYLQELDAEGTSAGAPKSINQLEPSLGTFWHPLAARPDRKELVVFPLLNYATLTGSVFVAP